MSSAAERIEELRERIRRADHLYYNEGTPELSDAEYDGLFRELRKLEQDHPELQADDSPTQRVGAPLPSGSNFAKDSHMLPMLSIESLTSSDEVEEFVDRARRYLDLPDSETLQWSVEPKFDGVSANLLYRDGKLIRGLSRGDGAQGEVITQNLRTIREIPLAFPGSDQGAPATIEVRGEVILSRDSFARLRELSETTMDTPFRNARNTVSGTLKLLDPAVVARRSLDFLCWGIGHVEGLEVDTYAELRERLQAFGFRTSEQFAVVDDAQGIIDFHDDLESRRESIQYEMDGIVAKVNDLSLQRRLGRTARTPRWTLAHKFAPQQASTRVEAIAAQVGRTGAITPVAHLEPVELAGVTVRRATLHNWDLLAQRDVREGDRVLIERAGDVIPAVVEVLTAQRPEGSRPTVAPDRCPTCETEVEAEGAFLYCVNPECPDQLRGRIVHMASRRALEILRLGPKYVDQLVEAGLLRTLEDVFTLPDRRDAILELERWGEKSVSKLEQEIEKARTPTLPRFLYGLGIRHVGEQTAKDLAEEFGSLEKVLGADQEQLEQVEGVGKEVAASIGNFFSLPQTRRFLEAAKHAGLQVQEAAKKEEGPLAGRVFCFTGGLSSMSRDEARAKVEALGAKASSSITKKVTDVVAGEKAGSKLEKAKKLGLEILEEEDLVQLLQSLT